MLVWVRFIIDILFTLAVIVLALALVSMGAMAKDYQMIAIGYIVLISNMVYREVKDSKREVFNIHISKDQPKKGSKKNAKS